MLKRKHWNDRIEDMSVACANWNAKMQREEPYTHEDIEKATAEYLARGGEITKLDDCSAYTSLRSSDVTERTSINPDPDFTSFD